MQDNLIQKSPFRLLRYIALLINAEVIRGNAAKRRRFVGRIVRRISQRLGLYKAAAFVYKIFFTAACALKLPAERKKLRAAPRWMWATLGLANRDYLRAWIEQRYTGGPKIVVIGMGSIGDILQITPVLRALREKLPTAQICLLHRSPAAKMVLAGNPNVDSIALADFYTFAQMKHAVAIEGIADLAVEIQSISYVITYTRAPEALQHPDFKKLMPPEFFVKAASALALWKKHPPVFPRKDEKFAWPEEWRPFQYLDVLGMTGNLPIDRNAPLDFVIGMADEAVLERLPKNKPIVTIQNGVDTDVMNWSHATGRMATKLLPMKTWNEIVRQLCADNFTVIQLGGEDDEAVAGVTLDLRGKTTLREAAVVVKHAHCHVGTEGGLVHLARAVGTTSVVMFGPTSVAFLGYPQNINLVASDCTSCWWTTKDWYVYCPRSLAEPECMYSHKAETVVGAVREIKKNVNREEVKIAAGTV